MSALLDKINILKNLDAGAHWFCGRNDGRSPDSDEPTPTKRQELAFEGIMVFSYDGANAEEPKIFMKNGITRNLLRCESCIFDYYKGKGKLLDGLREEGFEDDQVDTFAEWLDDQAIERISRGLERARDQLQDLANPEHQPSALSRSNLMSLVETLYCKTFRADEKRYALFGEVFESCQRKAKLSPAHLSPALVDFAFDEDEFRRAWALGEWTSMGEVTSLQDFNFALRSALADVTKKVAPLPVTDLTYATRFWVAMKEILAHLTPELITHGLRTLDIDICRLTIDHLNTNSSTFVPLMQCITTLLEKTPTDFWDAMGPISPKAIIEGIFHNAIYDQVMSGKVDDQTRARTEIQALTNWVKPFMISVQSSNQPPACRQLVSQFLRRLQDTRFTLEGRETSYCAGLNVLKWVILTRLQQGTVSDAVSRAVAIDLLAIVAEYWEDIIANIENENINGLNSSRIRGLCQDVVKAALTLECRLLRIDHVTLSKNKQLTQGSEHVSLGIWKKIVPRIEAKVAGLAEYALPATTELSDLGQFGPKSADGSREQRERFNKQFEECINLIARVFERIGDMKSSDIEEFVQRDSVRSALVAALLSSEDTLYQAAMNVAKTMSGNLLREDALRHLLMRDPVGFLGDFSDILDRISKSRYFYSCPRMLLTSQDILGIMTDSQDGLLRKRDIESDLRKSLLRYWQGQWRALTVIYDMTERWSAEHDQKTLMSFCRDVMQFSERLFDQYAVFQGNMAPSTSGSNNNEAGTMTPKELLMDPSRTMDSMVGWLRLRDEYLVETAVAIVQKLIDQLYRNDMQVGESAERTLLKIMHNETRTKLSLRQKAELAKALEGDDKQEDISIISPRKTGSSVNRINQKSSKGSGFDWGTWSAGLKAGDVRTQEVVDLTTVGVPNRSKEIKDIGSSITTSRTSQEFQKYQTQAQEVQRKSEEKRKAAEAQQASFLEKRRQEKLEKLKNDRAAVARLKGNQDSLASQTSGAGSALNGIGNFGKDHSAKKGTGLYLSSDEDSDSDDGDDILFANNKSKFSTAFKEADAMRRKIQPSQGPVKKTKQVRSAADMRARLVPKLGPLHRIILSWDLFTGGDFPPGTAAGDYTAVMGKFRTPTNYKSTFEPLLLLEAWQGFKQTLEEGMGKPFRIHFASRLSVDDLIEVSTSVESADLQNMGLGESDIVILSTDKDSEASPCRCLARVYKIGRQRQSAVDVTFRLSPDGNSLLSKLVAKAELWCAKLGSLTPLEREYSALSALQYYDLCDEIIRAVPSPLLKYSDEKLNKIGRMYDLNKAQAGAVQSAVDNDAFTLIQGPPGSGKTKTIVSIVGALLTETLKKKYQQARAIPSNSNQTGNSNTQGPASAAKKLLVCAPSNAAVDELVMRLMDGVRTYTGEVHKIGVIRLGKSDKINPKVSAVTLDELVKERMNQNQREEKGPSEIAQAMTDHKKTSEEINKLRATMDDAEARNIPKDPQHGSNLELLKRRRQQLSTRIDQLKDSGNTAIRESELRRHQVQQQILDSAEILCATLSGSGHDIFQRLKIDFETVIIDEAAQSVELSALIPLKYGCQKCIMVGDPKQLPPTVLSREAARFQYEQSLFVRMQNNDPENVHLLDTQYRMHPDISRFPSSAFYDGKLQDGPSMTELRTKFWHQDEYLGPYRFFNVEGKHEAGIKGHSLVNTAEVDAAMQLYKRLSTVASGYDFSGKVGIITPYKSQLQRLRDTFRRAYGEDIFKTIEFNTTDAFQGREAEVIIFSCVRASEGGIGFLSDIRRMNVGITRAKCSLWVLGNIKSLQRGEFWRKMIDDARSRKLITEGNISKLVGKPARRLHNNEPVKDNSEVQSSMKSPTSPIESVKPKQEAGMKMEDVKKSSAVTNTPTQPVQKEDYTAKRKRSLEPGLEKMPTKSPRIEASVQNPSKAKLKKELMPLETEAKKASPDGPIEKSKPQTKKLPIKPPVIPKPGSSNVFMKKSKRK